MVHDLTKYIRPPGATISYVSNPPVAQRRQAGPQWLNKILGRFGFELVKT